MNLRKLARDKPCMVRLPGICCGDPATTVLAHVRLPGLSGMGIKAWDGHGAWCCHTCHAYADTHHDDATKVAFYEGVLRTQAALLKLGALNGEAKSWVQAKQTR